MMTCFRVGALALGLALCTGCSPTDAPIVNAASGSGGTPGAAGTGNGGAIGGAAGSAISTGGVAGVSGGAGGGGTGGARTTPCEAAMLWTGLPTRPELTDAAAECFTAQRYLAASGVIGALVTDNWDPSAGLPDPSSLTPTFTVATDGSGTHGTVQAAIDAANATDGSSRIYILVKPGTYREVVCVKGTVPITLYGADADASQVTIAFDNYSGKTVAPQYVNPCNPPGNPTYGTSGSTTFGVASTGFEAMNITIANDYAEPDSGTYQAVAMTTTGDRLVFQNVRLIGNQDTLQPGSPSGAIVARSYYLGSYIEGDTDFIFGRGVAVFDDCDITYVGTRKNNGAHLAPSSDGTQPYGFLIVSSRISAGADTEIGKTALGRAWDVSSQATANGQAVIRETEIGDHVNLTAPWKASTQDRPFDADTNRLYEYKNTGAGAAP